MQMTLAELFFETPCQDGGVMQSAMWVKNYKTSTHSASTGARRNAKKQTMDAWPHEQFMWTTRKLTNTLAARLNAFNSNVEDKGKDTQYIAE